jgi:hypothetical protein
MASVLIEKTDETPLLVAIREGSRHIWLADGDDSSASSGDSSILTLPD